MSDYDDFEDLHFSKTDEDLQLAENYDVDQNEETVSEFEKKRELLKKTRIVRQTWSILEIVQKIRDNNLILDPDYQRSVVWDKKKQTSFIESLYMEIMIPPIYVVEIPGESVLDVNKYEVVDGKQRLSAIQSYINNDLELDKKSLEYYKDIFGGKSFKSIQTEYSEQTSEMLSSILDVYVITSKSPEFTKYDIFARLNKGSEKLRVNEIRRAIYHSRVSTIIKNYIDENYTKTEYRRLFSKNAIKRFDDYGRFYKSVAFFVQTDLEKKVVQDYNSRPRDMINTVLAKLQEGTIKLEDDEVNYIVNRTIDLLKCFHKNPYREYLVDSCIPFINSWDRLVDNIDIIESDPVIQDSLKKSPATTSNVDKRVQRITEILDI